VIDPLYVFKLTLAFVLALGEIGALVGFGSSFCMAGRDMLIRKSLYMDDRRMELMYWGLALNLCWVLTFGLMYWWAMGVAFLVGGETVFARLPHVLPGGVCLGLEILLVLFAVCMRGKTNRSQLIGL
jgi:hypothetical protein